MISRTVRASRHVHWPKQFKTVWETKLYICWRFGEVWTSFGHAMDAWKKVLLLWQTDAAQFYYRYGRQPYYHWARKLDGLCGAKKSIWFIWVQAFRFKAERFHLLTVKLFNFIRIPSESLAPWLSNTLTQLIYFGNSFRAIYLYFHILVNIPGIFKCGTKSYLLLFLCVSVEFIQFSVWLRWLNFSLMVIWILPNVFHSTPSSKYPMESLSWTEDVMYILAC